MHSNSKIFIKDGAAGVRKVNQYCVCKIVDGTAWYYNENVKNYWAAFATVLTKQEAKRVLKFMRKFDRQHNATQRRKVNIVVSYCDNFNVWNVDASNGRVGTSLSFVRKPSTKQLRQLRKAVSTASFNSYYHYSIKKGKFVKDGK